MTTRVDPHEWVPRTRSDMLRALWSPRSWKATCHVVAGMVVGFVSFIVVPLLAVLAVVLLPTLIGAAASVTLLIVLNRGLTALQRSRFEDLLGLSIPRTERSAEPPVRRIVREVTDAGTWRQLAYHVFAGLLGFLTGLVVVTVWSAGFTLTPAIVYATFWGGISIGEGAVLSAVGLVLLLAAPWCARATATADMSIARSLLGADPTAELTRRVADLTESRGEVVDAADAERRRIERDLHDGVQQRLTSLAVNLGIARATLTDASEPALAAITDAHDEAKQALVDLREVVRGMHPAVLNDRGLDAALSGIAARSPVPVRLRVTLTQRAARDVEAVAYFLVSEALTNATAHAEASQVDVTVELRDEVLHVAVCDDGRGGADPDRGTGLHGLVKRVRSVDGSLHIGSPPGGPTSIVAEMPCAS